MIYVKEAQSVQTLTRCRLQKSMLNIHSPVEFTVNSTMLPVAANRTNSATHMQFYELSPVLNNLTTVGNKEQVLPLFVYYRTLKLELQSLL